MDYSKETTLTIYAEDGYMYINFPGQKPIPVHIYILTQQLKRQLGSKETIVHKNGIKTDNRLENIEVIRNVYDLSK